MWVLFDVHAAIDKTYGSLLAAGLKSRVASTEKAGMQTVGNGFMNGAVNEFYSKWIVVKDSDELASAVLEKLSAIFLEGV